MKRALIHLNLKRITYVASSFCIIFIILIFFDQTKLQKSYLLIFTKLNIFYFYFIAASALFSFIPYYLDVSLSTNFFFQIKIKATVQT